MAHYKIRKKPGEAITVVDVVKKLQGEIDHSLQRQKSKFAGGHHLTRESVLKDFLNSLMEDITLNVEQKRSIINGY
jgi:DNA-binding IscR family transcriptional regulator